MKRVFIVHGWGGKPEKDWLSWLALQLKAQQFDARLPRMPNTEHPTIAGWVGELAKQVGVPDVNTYFVGHSLGCQAIMRYLQTRNEQIGGIIFVAPATKISEAMTVADTETAMPWMETPIDYIAVQQRTKHIIAFFSEDDDVVPVSQAAVLRENLSAHIIIEQGKGHYTTEDGITEVPQVLDALLELMKER